MDMKFFDCNVSYGFDIKTDFMNAVKTVDELNYQMNRSGISKAMVNRLEQFSAGTAVTNELLADDISKYTNMYGVWVILPSCTHEIPEGEQMLRIMKEKRIFGWRLLPGIGKYMVRDFIFKDWFEVAIQRKIPIFINTSHGANLEKVADILKSFPDLTLILTHTDIWPSDRMIRPFVEHFPNVYIDLTYSITDGGISDFVKIYGSKRLLYGSGFPYSYFGANMLMIKHAEISEKEKEAIASGNMTNIIEGVML